MVLLSRLNSAFFTSCSNTARSSRSRRLEQRFPGIGWHGYYDVLPCDRESPVIGNQHRIGISLYSHTREIIFQSSNAAPVWFGEPLNDLSKIPLQVAAHPCNERFFASERARFQRLPSG